MNDNIEKAFDEYYPNDGRLYGASPYLQAKSDFKAGYEAAMKEKEFNLDAFGGWLIEIKAPTSVLHKFREARKQINT